MFLCLSDIIVPGLYQFRDWVAAVCLLLADQPSEAELLDWHSTQLRPTQPATNWIVLMTTRMP